MKLNTNCFFCQNENKSHLKRMFSFLKYFRKMKISQENVKRAVRKASQCAIQEECV